VRNAKTDRRPTARLGHLGDLPARRGSRPQVWCSSPALTGVPEHVKRPSHEALRTDQVLERGAMRWPWTSLPLLDVLDALKSPMLVNRVRQAAETIIKR